MSNSHLFMKSGFPRAVAYNGFGRYVCQLQRITFKFCKNHGSSRCIREFIESDLLNFAKENPGIAIYVKPRRHRSPVIVGEYLNGDREWMSCRDSTKDDICKWVELLRTQKGCSSSVRLRKMWHTDIPSIQSPWTPFTLKQPSDYLKNYPDIEALEPIEKQKSATETLLELYQQEKVDASQ